MNTPTPIKNYIAEGRAKQRAAEAEREKYSAEEMTAVEKLTRVREILVWYGLDDPTVSRMKIEPGNKDELRKLLGLT